MCLCEKKGAPCGKKQTSVTPPPTSLNRPLAPCPSHVKVHGKLDQYEAAIDCYRRSIAVNPAAPAYVAWALVVAKLAAKTQKDLSTTKVRHGTVGGRRGGGGQRGP